MPEITLEHIRDLIQGARDESRAYDEGIRTEIRGVNRRLDKVNGQLDTHAERLTKVENGTFAHQRKSDPAPVKRLHSRSDDGKSVTNRDVKVGLGCAGLAVGAVIWILELMGRI